MSQWIITHDHYPVGNSDKGIPDECEAQDSEGRTMGRPVHIPCNGFDYSIFAKQLMISFRLYDEDGILYYSGFMSEHYFEPLTDFAMPDSGATRLDYWDFDSKTWKTL